MKNLLVIAIIVRLLTNIQQSFDWLYFLGRDVYEFITLYIMYNIMATKYKDIIMLCMIQCVWCTLKPLVLNPRVSDYWEISVFVISIIFYVKKRYYSHN